MGCQAKSYYEIQGAGWAVPICAVQPNLRDSHVNKLINRRALHDNPRPPFSSWCLDYQALGFTGFMSCQAKSYYEIQVAGWAVSICAVQPNLRVHGLRPRRLGRATVIKRWVSLYVL